MLLDLKQRTADLFGVPVSSVQLAVAAGSVVVVLTITTDVPDVRNNVTRTFTEWQDPAIAQAVASAALGINVTAAALNDVSVQITIAPSPPPPMPPPSPPPPVPATPPPSIPPPGLPPAEPWWFAQQCSPGFRHPLTNDGGRGSGACEACPIGTSSQDGFIAQTKLSTCPACPRGTLQPREGQTSCESCPGAGVDCEYRAAVHVQLGFYRASNDSAIAPLRCPEHSHQACLGGPLPGDTSCATGHYGPFCGICINGYYRPSEGNCQRCPSPDALEAPSLGVLLLPYIIVLLALILLIMLHFSRCFAHSRARRRLGASMRVCLHLPESVGHLWKQWWWYLKVLPRPMLGGHSGTLAKIVLGYVQVLGPLSKMKYVRWPPMFVEFLNFFDIFYFDLFKAVPLECLIGDVSHRALLERCNAFSQPSLLAPWLLA